MSLKATMRDADDSLAAAENEIGEAIARALKKHASLIRPDVLDKILAEVEPATRVAVKRHMRPSRGRGTRVCPVCGGEGTLLAAFARRAMQVS